MKKFILSVAALALVVTSCGSTSTATTTTTPTTTEPAKTSTIDKVAQLASTVSQITSIFGANTNLSSDQKSSLMSTVTKYVSNYNSISNLETTDKAAYTTKLSDYASQALGSVKETVSENQYAQILSNIANYTQENSTATSTTNNTLATLLSSFVK